MNDAIAAAKKQIMPPPLDVTDSTERHIDQYVSKTLLLFASYYCSVHRNNVLNEAGIGTKDDMVVA